MEQFRKIRDDNSAKTMHMTFEELKAYYKESLSDGSFDFKTMKFVTKKKDN